MPDKHQPNSDKSDFGQKSFLDGLLSNRENANFLANRNMVAYCKEWNILYDAEDIKFEVSENHPFGIVLKMKYAAFIDPVDEINISKFFLGIKLPEKLYRESIEMGLYMGRLYLNHVFDAITIPRWQLIEGIHMVLTVEPQPNGFSEAILTALDLTGAVISKIRNPNILNADWKGGIAIGAHYKTLRIEGFRVRQ